MTQTLAPPAAAHSVQPALFDVLARSWQLDAPVSSIALDRAGKTAGFALADGRIALMPLEDPDSALKRMRIEADSGRSTIRPREKPVAAPILTDPLAEGAAFLVPSGVLGFVAGSRDGRLNRITPRGQVIALTRKTEPLSALASDGQGRLAIARDGQSSLHAEEGMERLFGLLTPGSAHALAFAPDGQSLAVMTENAVFLWQPGHRSARHPLGGKQALTFSQDGNWLAAPEGEGFWLLRLSDGRAARLGRFRASPATVAFSGGANAVFASGAFRVAGWSLADPPFDDEATGALRTGRPGLVLVDRVAPHPARDLIAFGMADGAVSIAQAGRGDEMTLRHADGAAITALVWSADGTHLAIGTAQGDAALVTLPPQLFK